MSDSPLVSIALPVFNAEKTLATAVRSILYQTYSNWELFIIDDGSTDNSLSIAQSFNDPRIRVISGDSNEGISCRLNQAISLCNGEYFARMDADDVSFPKRIETQLDYMKAHYSLDLLGAGMLVYIGDGFIQGVFPIKETHEDICKRPWGGFYLPHPTWLGRTEWFLKHRYRSLADGAEDQDLLFRTYRSSRFACLTEVLLAYREEPRSINKMFSYRSAFFRAIFSEALRSRRYEAAYRLLFLQPAKVTGDILNLKFGLKGLRNPLMPASPFLTKYWEHIWSITK